VLRFCPNEGGRADQPLPDGDAALRARLRGQFRDADASLRERIDYENAHPGAIVVWGQTPRSDAEPAITQFGEAVGKAGRPDCMHEYSGAGLLAPLAMAADAIRDNPCHF
jgi:hypothetical protein